MTDAPNARISTPEDADAAAEAVSREIVTLTSQRARVREEAAKAAREAREEIKELGQSIRVLEAERSGYAAHADKLRAASKPRKPRKDRKQLSMDETTAGQ